MFRPVFAHVSVSVFDMAFVLVLFDTMPILCVSK